MSRRYIPKVVTANRLREGDVVYLTADNLWTPHHHEAELIEDEAHAQAGANGPEPVHFREAFRTRGPSNYAHGKQVDLTHV